AGLEFAGISPASPGLQNSRSSISGSTSGINILEAIKLDKMSADQHLQYCNVRIPLVKDLHELLCLISENVSNSSSDTVLSLQVDGHESEHFISHFIEPHSIDIFSTNFDRIWKAHQNIQPPKTSAYPSDNQVLMVHLRLGDT